MNRRLRLLRTAVLTLSAQLSVASLARADLVGDVAGTFAPRVRLDQSIQLAPELSVIRGSNKGNLVADPFRFDVYWAATYGSGVWKTTDGGHTWVPKNLGLANLLVDRIQPDPEVDGRLYALQRDSGHVSLSTNGGESWVPIAVCSGPWARTSAWTDLSISLHPELPLKSMWATKFGIQSDCGHLFRSDDAGETWCYYMTECDSELFPWTSYACQSGLNQFVGNDGLGAVAIAGTSDAYFIDDKNHLEWMCKGLHRTEEIEPGLEDWGYRDEWAGPAEAPADTMCGSFRAHHTWQLDYDPDPPGGPPPPSIRFSSLRNWCWGTCHPGDTTSCCCDLSDPNTWRWWDRLWDLHIAYHDGVDIVDGRRQWKSAVDLKKCFALASAADCCVKPRPPECVTAIDARPIRFAYDGVAKDIFAEIVNVNSLGGLLWRCDATTDTADCYEPGGWECIFNFSDKLSGCIDSADGPPCAEGDDDWQALGYGWGDVGAMEVSTERGAGGHFEVLFKGRPLIARDEFLRVFHDGADWQGEHLEDPVTCEHGIGLLTPLQVVEVNLDGGASADDFIMTSRRHWFSSTDGGTNWQAFNPFTIPVPAPPGPPVIVNYSMWERAPILAPVPSQPGWLYAFHDAHLWRSTDNGKYLSWARMDWVERKGSGIRMKGCKGDWDECTAGQQPDPIDPCITDERRCGRFVQMCGDVNQIAVDPNDANTVYAATERGLWKWTWPFDGKGFCRPLITDPLCLWWMDEYGGAGLAWSGKQWSLMGTGPEMDKGFLAIAPDPDPAHPEHFLAGGRDGLYESTDNGATWGADLVVTGMGVHEVLFAPSDVVLAATDAGVYRRAGASPFSLRLPEVSVFDLSLYDGPGAPTVFAAVTDYDETSYHEGLYRSTDGGQDWRKVVLAEGNQEVMSVHVTSDGSKVFAGLLGGGLVRADVAAPPTPGDCSRLSVVAPAMGLPGHVRMGTALAGVGDLPFPTADDMNCRSEWAALEFQLSPPHAIVRLFNHIGNPVLGLAPVDPGFNLLDYRASLAILPDYLGAGCQHVVIGLPRPQSPTEGVVAIMNICGGATLSFTEPTPEFGTALAVSGDRQYLAVGAPSPFAARVYVYGLTTSPPTLVRTLNAPIGSNSFGWALAFGNLDGGSGPDDLAVGAPDVDQNGQIFGSGHVYLYDGAVTWSTLTRTILGPGNPAGFGFSLSSGYDRGGDGKDDLVVGAPNDLDVPGGSRAGSVSWYEHMTDASPDRSVGEAALDGYGWSVLLTRDVTGDLLPDVVVGAPANLGAGAVYVVEGATRTCKVAGSVAGGSFGHALAEAGDIDKNRTIDLVIGQPEPAGSGPGTVFLDAVLR